MPTRPLQRSSRSSAYRAGLQDVGVAEDRLELIGKSANAVDLHASEPQPIREPGDIVKILKLAA